MKVLILHAWLRGNLGDEILTSKVVERIKQIRGTYIHLISIHPDKSYRCPIKGLVDRFSTQSYKNHCDHEIEEADIVCIAPGGGLQKIGDERAPYIYRDAASALKKRKIVVFCGHSFCRELINKPILAFRTRYFFSFNCRLCIPRRVSCRTLFNNGYITFSSFR
jgi:polysaccharide pyruvyl transferase WcaK-like protein